MLVTTKVENTFITCVMTLLLSLPILLHAQHDSYLGNEAKLFKNELVSKAVATDFGDKYIRNNRVYKLQSNEKNR